MSFSPIIEQLIERLQNRESLDLEFKDCRGDLSNDLWETVCAFANTQGGWLLIGVDKKGLPVGFDEDYANRLKKDLFDVERNKNKISREVFTDNDIELDRDEINNKVLIVVRVAAVPRTSKPVFLNNNPMIGTFVRRHESDYIRNWNNLGFQLPKMEVGTERYEFIIQLKNAHLLTDDDRKWLKSIGASEFDEHQQLALICAKHEGKVDNERLRTMSSLHPSDATRILTGLRDRELLTKINDRRGTYYMLPGSPYEGPTLFQFNQNATNRSEGEENSKPLQEISEDLKEKLKTLKEDAEIFKELEITLQEKLTRKQIRELKEAVILRLCEVKPRKSKQLSELLNTTQTNLNNYYLTPLTHKGLLQWTGSSVRDKSGTYKTTHEEK